ncbi:MAG: hypothetical protein IPL62_16485 [Caulobacteraceae bacterium]|nr:hypothetical protein [Caulobacteraceae bacterium]
MPTVRPHLLSQQFADLCEEDLPAGPGVWEATRFCPAPDTPAGPPRRDMLGRMIAGIMETALLFGVDQVTYVADAALAPMAQKVGWDVRARCAARQGTQSHSSLCREHRWRGLKARARSFRHQRAADAVRTRRPRARRLKRGGEKCPSPLLRPATRSPLIWAPCSAMASSCSMGS